MTVTVVSNHGDSSTRTVWEWGAGSWASRVRGVARWWVAERGRVVGVVENRWGGHERGEDGDGAGGGGWRRERERERERRYWFSPRIRVPSHFDEIFLCSLGPYIFTRKMKMLCTNEISRRSKRMSRYTALYIMGKRLKNVPFD